MNEMYCDLQSRGIKRKFVEDDDSGDQSQQLPSSDAISAINSSPIVSSKAYNSNSTKNSIHTTITSRILQHSLTVQNCYVRQRQQIFNISICKLNRFRQSSDPSLLRSVLVCNGLKTLERELFREGIKINFGPNGVSFTPPVLNTQNMTLDPPPSALNSLGNQNNSNNCNNSLNISNNNNSANCVNQFEAKTSTDVSNYEEISSETNGINDNSNGEYDKYLLDLDSSSGRVTPFQKTQVSVSVTNPINSVYENNSSMDYSSSSLPQSSNGAFWGSDEASDRLTSLNWSSVFNSSSVTTSSSGVPKSTQFNVNGHESNAINGSDESVPIKSPNSSSFTTLLPPSAAITTTSVTATTSISTTSLSLSSASVSTASLSQNSNSSQNVTNSHSVNHLSVINGNQITFSNNTTNDEIFGDIDLSLYDFDLLTPLSPPYVKLAPITAEELIRNISPNDSNSSSVSSSSSSVMTSSPLSSSSSLSSNGSSIYSSSGSSGFHGRYFKSSDKLFSDDRDQKAITPVMS